jgi:uncharacterized protein YxjI
MAPQGGAGDAFDVVRSRSRAGQLGLDNHPVRNSRYRMSSELAMRGADFLVLNDTGEHVFRFSGDALAAEDTLRVEDMQGQLLYRAPARFARKQARIGIVDGDASEMGAVLRQLISPLRDRFAIELRGGLTLDVEGTVSTHEFWIVGRAGPVAEISQKWFRARGSYGVEIVPGQQDALLLIAIAVMDQMIHGTT